MERGGSRAMRSGPHMEPKMFPSNSSRLFRQAIAALSVGSARLTVGVADNAGCCTLAVARDGRVCADREGERVGHGVVLRSSARVRAGYPRLFSP